MSKSILIVDDEPELLATLKEFVKPYFDKVYLAADGVEALLFLKEQSVSIILSDISMPRLAGDDFLRRLRVQGIHTPVVFLTGNGTMAHAVTALKLGAVDFLEKPFEVEKLVETLDYCLKVVERKGLILQLEMANNDKDASLLRSEKKTLGILQAAKEFRKRS